MHLFRLFEHSAFHTHIVRFATKQLKRKEKNTQMSETPIWRRELTTIEIEIVLLPRAPSRITQETDVCVCVVVSANWQLANWQRTLIRSAYLAENSHGIFSSRTNSHVSTRGFFCFLCNQMANEQEKKEEEEERNVYRNKLLWRRATWNMCLEWCTARS